MEFKDYKKQIEDNKQFLLSYMKNNDFTELFQILKNCPIWLFNNSNKLSIFMENTKLMAQYLMYDIKQDMAYLLKNEDKQNIYAIKKSFIDNQYKYMKNPDRNLYIYNQELKYKQMIILLNKNTPKAFIDEVKGIDFSFFHEMGHIILMFNNMNNQNHIKMNSFIYKTIYNLYDHFSNNEILKRKLDKENICENYADLMSIYLMNKKDNQFNLKNTINELINFRIDKKLTHHDYSHDSSSVIEKAYFNNFFNLDFNKANQVFLLQSIHSFYVKIQEEIKQSENLSNQCSKIMMKSNSELQSELKSVENFLINIDDIKADNNAFSSSPNKESQNIFLNMIDDELHYLENTINNISQNLKKEVKLNNFK
jgi:hypothetical protein